LYQIGDEKVDIGNEKDARALTEEAQTQAFIVDKVVKREKKEILRHPSLPAHCNRRLQRNCILQQRKP